MLSTVIKHCGSQEDPWKIDQKKPTKGKAVAASSSTGASDGDQGLVDILQQPINQLFPRKHYELASDDIIVRVVSGATVAQILLYCFIDRPRFTDAPAYIELETRFS